MVLLKDIAEQFYHSPDLILGKIMKKILMTALCVAVSSITFAENGTTNQRIEILEAELQRLKQEVAEQKEQQHKLATDQVDVVTAVQTAQVPAKTWVDNVDLYGIVRLDGAIDFKDTSARARTGNQINRVPFDATTGTASDFTIAASRLGMDIKNLAGRDDVTAKFEGDFWVDQGKGDGKLRIRHAYVGFDNWLFGQTWSLMSNTETMTEGLDYTQLLGVSTSRLPQVRYDFRFNAANVLQLALEYAGDRTSALPSFTGKYTYRDQNLQLMGQGFINEKQAQLADKTVKDLSWGVGAGFRYKFNPQQSVQAHYYHIKGDQKFVSYTTQGSSADGAAWGGDFSVDQYQNSLLLNEFDVLSVGYSHKFNAEWRANIATAMLKYNSSNAYAKANLSANKALTDHTFSVIYTPAPQVDLGAEYHLGQRENFKGDTVDISRINLAAIYKF